MIDKPSFGKKTVKEEPVERKKIRSDGDNIAVWEKTSEKGKRYLSIKLNIFGYEVNVRAYENADKKPGDNRPDYTG